MIYRLLATHLAHKAGFRCKEAATGAVTLVQRFGSALNLNIHLHMLCLDGVYAPRPDGGLRFTRVKAPEREELEHLVQQIAARLGRALERMGLLQRDSESAWLDLPPGEDTDAMRQLIGSSVTYRIAVGPQAGRKALVLRTIRPLAGEEPRNERVAKANGFSLHAGVSCEARQREVRERLCRYDVQGCTSVAGGRMPGATLARPAGAEKRLPPRGGRKTAHGECAGEGGVPAQDAVPGRDDACGVRTPGLHRASGSASAEAACKPDQIPRGTGTEPPLACGGDAGRKGQGEECGCSAREVRDRAACGDELGTAAEAGLWHRRGELRALRQVGACCRSCASMRPRH